MATIGEMLDRSNGAAPGFDRLRIILATLVIFVHSERVAVGTENNPLARHWVTADLIVPWFFMLSGFLVTLSAQRHRLPVFLLNRCARIYPALIACVMLTVFALGPAVTTLPLETYFTSPETWSYLLSATGWPRFYLPGVFETLPDAGTVNVSIWTIRWEIGCYLVVASLAFTGLFRRLRLVVLATAVLATSPLLALLSAWWLYDQPEAHSVARMLISHRQTAFVTAVTLPASGASTAYWLIETVAGWNFRIVPYFFAGSLVALARYRISVSPWLAGLGAIVLAICELGLPDSLNGPLFYVLAMVPSLYCVVWLGFKRFRPISWLDQADYSYGIYLYGFPIQQLVQAAGLDRGIGWLNALLAVPFTLAAAMASWHFIERPVLSLRGSIWQRFPSIRPRPASQ